MNESVITPACELLGQWLGARLSPAPLSWLEEKVARLSGEASDRDLFIAVGMAPRKLGKADLSLSEEELHQAGAIRSGWDPSDWSVDQAARIYLLLRSWREPSAFFERFEKLFDTAEVGELVAYYRGLALYPEPERFVARAMEGLRSNMKPVFEAVAHGNPFAPEQLDERAWNHMVLKALFIGSKLYPIQRLDERSNPALTRTLCQYAHERWSAGRSISVELWRCVGPYADDSALADLERVLSEGTEPERLAAVLALQSASQDRATQLLKAVPDLEATLERQGLV